MHDFFFPHFSFTVNSVRNKQILRFGPLRKQFLLVPDKPRALGLRGASFSRRQHFNKAHGTKDYIFLN